MSGLVTRREFCLLLAKPGPAENLERKDRSGTSCRREVEKADHRRPKARRSGWLLQL